MDGPDRRSSIRGMTMRSTNRSGQAHTGTGSHHAGHHHDPLANYELTGTVRWLDEELQRVVLGVEHTGGHAGPFLGRDVTIDLAAAALHGAALSDLTPGARLRVKTRLHTDLGTVLPELVSAHSAYAAD